MHRKRFIALTGGAVLAAASTAYWMSDKKNLSRADLRVQNEKPGGLTSDEYDILALASLAPSGHNTQPWFVLPLAPCHWIIGNDFRRWLPAVDPTQRETVLSLGAFLENLERAAGAFVYVCHFELLAANNQDERVGEVNLIKDRRATHFDIDAIKARRTVRSGFATHPLKREDLASLSGADAASIHYLPANEPAGRFVSAQTVVANRLQAERSEAQRELADWIRFSSQEAEKHRDGLTTGGMEINGLAGWVVRNFYSRDNVLTQKFKKESLQKLETEVAALAGWILITSPDRSVAALLDAGRKMQKLFLRARRLNIGIHPMTQILEEPATERTLPGAVGVTQPIQFILRTGYVSNYPPPVSLRRPVSWFLRS